MPLPSLKTFYQLTKPGIIRGNLLTATAGFLLAAQGHIKPGLLLALLGGITLIVASACVVNNYIDRRIDQKMQRTAQRALVTGVIPARIALTYAATLGVAGVLILGLGTNSLTLALGCLAFFIYVVLYSLAKRRSVHGTLVGCLCGALPPVAGYTAVTNHLDIAALLIFVAMVFWQLAHFYAIAIYRLKDYAAAGLPVMPVKHGIASTKRQIMAYITAFILIVSWLAVLGYLSKVALALFLLAASGWLIYGLKSYRLKSDRLWGQKMFRFSLVVILVFCITLSIGGPRG